MIIIKQLQLKDLFDFYPSFKEIILNEFPYYHPKIRQYFVEKIYNLKTIKYWLETKQKIILVALIDNKIVGFAMIDLPYGGVSFLRWLGIKKDFQKKGIGKKLVEEWEKLASIWQCHKIELATYLTIVGFYEKLGFQKEGIRKLSYFGIDQFMMGKVINKINIDAIVKTEFY